MSTTKVNTKATHTPGPWRVFSGPGARNRIVGPSPINEQIGETYHANQDANAHLIAAAPDHHAASLSTVDRLADLPRWLRLNGGGVLGDILEEELNKHRKAIAKAEGGAS